MPNLSINPVELSLKDKLQSQLILLTESKDKINIHLDLLKVDLKRNLSADYLTKQARIIHLEKAESNLLQHIFFLQDIMQKIGGNYNNVTS